MVKKITFLSVIFVLILSSCIKREEFLSFAGFAQGTTYRMIYAQPEKLNLADIRYEVDSILSAFDKSLSLYEPSSTVSKVNRNEDVVIDTFFAEVFRKSKEISAMTEGAFDITVGPLVKAWGFGPDEHKNFSVQKLDSLMKLIGINKVELRNGRVSKADPGMNLDFNAIAQGYSVDVICRYFDGLGIKNYLVEIGGEVRVKGSKNGANWRIGIDKPVDNNMTPGDNLEAVIMLKNRSLATSGNYRKFYVENGIKYSHTIDPITGYPAKNQLLSATIIAKECATADGIATACMVMGKEKTIEFLGRHNEFEGYLVYSDSTGNFKTWTSDPLRRYISETE